jgi:hypothetical protein
MKDVRDAIVMAGLVMILAACSALAPGTSEPVAGAVEITHSEVRLLESYPVQVHLLVEGNLPSPCYELRWEVAEPDEENRILVRVWGEMDSQAICAQVIERFEETIPLGTYTSGAYTVWVNEEQVNQFDLGGEAMAPDQGSDRQPVYVDAAKAVITKGVPAQVALSVQGNLPTPCHVLDWEVSLPDADGKIEVQLFSTVDPEQICAQVLEPFDVSIPIGDFTEGSFTIWLNGEQVGEFTL